MENLLQQASSRGLLQSSSDNGSDSGNSTQTAFAVIGGVCALLVAVVVFVFYFLRGAPRTHPLFTLKNEYCICSSGSRGALGQQPQRCPHVC